MMRKILLIIAFLCSSFYISAQNIADVFLTMPDNIILGLESTEKEILIANAKDTTEIMISKDIGGSVKRLAVSDDYIALQTSEVGTTQIKLLPLINDSKIVCVVKTVCGSACDSQIRFYTTKWIPIEQNLFPEKNKDWFIKEDADRNSQDFKNVYEALDINLIKIEMSADNTTIKVFYDIEKYLSEEDLKKVQPFLLKEPKVFEWDKNLYK